MVVGEAVQHVYNLICKYIPDDVYNYLPESVITRTLLVGAGFGFMAYLIFRKRYNLPPGPWSLPLIGDRVFLSGGHMPEKLFNLSKIYGPVIATRMGPMQVVVLNNIEVANEALIKKGAQFASRLSIYSFDQMFHNSEDIIFSKFGTPWKLRRKVASRAIRLFMVTGTLDNKIEMAVSRTVAAMLKEKGAFNPKPYLFYTVLNIIAGMCFGTSYEYEDEEYRMLLSNMEEHTAINSEGVIFENICSIFAKFYTTSRYKQADRVMKEILKYIEGYVSAHRKKFVPGQVNDLTDSILQAEREIAAEGQDNMANFQPIHVILIVFDIFFAGTDTSSGTLNWALMYIIGVPGVQQKLQTELDSAIGREIYPTTADRDNLPYANAVLHEVMRMGPVAPLGVPHSTSGDATIGEYDIPKDTLIFINHWALHNDPSKWPEVNKFKPERYLDEDGQMGPKPENWLPFSAGRRVCVGEPLAKAELHLIIAAWFQRLEFSPDPDTPLNMEHSCNGFIITPHPYKIVVKKRI